MIREEFFCRRDLTPEQKTLLESARVLLIMLDNASGAFAQNQPSAALQISRHADVIGENAEGALHRFTSADCRRIGELFEVLSLFRRIVCALKRMCEAAAAPLEGLDEARKQFPVPETVPPEKRSLWLHCRLSSELAGKMRLRGFFSDGLQSDRIS